MIMTKKLYENHKDTLEYVKIITRKGATGSLFVTDEYFPIQKNDIIGTRIKVKYRRMVPYIHLGENVIYETRRCVVLRCDLTEPYIFIGWIYDTMDILVGDSRYYNTSILCQNGYQNEFLLVNTDDFYKDDEMIGISGTIVRADMSNSDIVVIAEKLSDSVIRFVLADETAALMKSYVPEPLSPKIDKRIFVDTMNDLLNNNTIYKSPISSEPEE